MVLELRAQRCGCLANESGLPAMNGRVEATGGRKSRETYRDDMDSERLTHLARQLRTLRALQ